MINKISKIYILLIIFSSLMTISCSSAKIQEVQFSYRGIIDKEYRFSTGRVIPVTISQSIETDGDISSDGNYFYYSSNADGGNYDIYLRSMGDITTVRITSHPSKDITPVISPDGKRLAFVSFRDDPEGDIYMIKLNAGDLLTRAAKGEEIPSLDRDAADLTIEKNNDTGVITNIRDSNPCWSPDGRSIAFSSYRGGVTGIWIMDSDGGSKRKISPKDGFYPSFSPDGSRIVYISYSDSINGDLYTLNISTGKAERLTNSDTIKLYPSYIAGNDRIIYSSIEVDTNGNGTLDLQDRSVIRLLDVKKGLTYPLTKSTDSSFKAKWLPVLNTRDYNGIIIYNDSTGENINLDIIPDGGIIPKKQNARLQYELCESYLSEYDDEEKYAMSLETVFYIFGDAADNSSSAYTDRGLNEAAEFYREKGENKKRERAVSFIRDRANKGDRYASFIIDLLENRKSWTTASLIKTAEDKSSRYFAPFAMEDLGDIAYGKGNRNDAAAVYREILSVFPDFERTNDILTKISRCTDDLSRGILSDATVKIVTTGNTNQKISVTTNLIAPLQKGKFSAAESSAIIKNLQSLKTKFGSDKKIMAILTLASGIVYDSAGKADAARGDLSESIKLSHPNDLTFYLANIRLAETEKRLGNNEEAEKYYSTGINRYSRRFKTENFRDKLLWLINYYEKSGEKSSAKRDFSNASQVYDKYINLITLIHNKRLYPEIYSEYAPRAHVLYIDAYTDWKGESGVDELITSYKSKLPVLRMDFNRAALYGLAYIYTKKAMFLDSKKTNLVSVSKGDVFKNLYDADRQIEWALFLDDTFIEPYLLKSWIYQFIDLQRKEYGDDIESSIGELFPQRLWEKNIPILEKALNANNENLRPENEGDIHLNLGNSYYLLVNYPRALYHYRLAQKYKKSFGSDIENALFHFHYGYTLWQDGEISEAREEISKSYDIYNRLSAGSAVKYKQQMLILYRYFALFSRYEEKYGEAITWYKKILKHADDTGLTIDRARYLQEIAYCYKETGDSDIAKKYIDQADRLLKDYPDDTRKYYLKISIFGIGPFPVWNMGPDTAVVGDNKIFYPLDTWNKKLLSISMLENMAVENANYTGAIDYLTKKINLLQESGTSVSVESRIISLNNLGYYFFISGKPGEAEKYFKEAGDLAADKNNRDAMFRSIMNLANLYALMIEDNYDIRRNWISDIEKFLDKIEKYRSAYYDLTFAQEKEKLESAAKAKQEKVTQEQLDELKSRVDKETSDIYYRLDTSIAVMKYYRAELLYSAEIPADSKNRPYDLYTLNREIYDLYAAALQRFESSITAADARKNIELKVKLLMNAATCYQKTGDYENAYVALIDAKNLSDQYRLGWTGINAYYSLGMFLANYGRGVESGDYRALAEKYISTAVSRIEEHPLLYSSRPGKLWRIYSDYSEFLARGGKMERGAGINERFARVERITSVNMTDPLFNDENDRNRYLSYASEISRLKEIREKRSSLLISGTAETSPEVEALNKQEKLQEEKLSRLLKEIKNKNSKIVPFLELTKSESIRPGVCTDSVPAPRLC